jgi:hypothetical protein
MARLKRRLQEVHQRSLWQLLASYIVGAWLVLQIAETLASLIGLPLWFGAGVIVLFAFGLVLVLATGLAQVIAAYRSDPDRSYSALRRLFSWKHALIAGLVALAVLVVATGGYMGLRVLGIGPAGTLIAKGLVEERERIVLADFENHTNDSTLAIAATEALRIDLDQSRVVRVAEPQFVERALQRMEQSSDRSLDLERARELAIGGPPRRCGLVRAGREALAWRVPRDRHEPHRHPGAARRQSGGLAGAGQRRAVRGPTDCGLKHCARQGDHHEGSRSFRSARHPLRRARGPENRGANGRDHPHVGVLRVRVRSVALPRHWRAR